MEKLALYRVADDYINFLRKIDSENIKFNKEEKRPYIGVVFKINDIKYFAPLTSPKKKYKTMKNSMDFIKIKNGEWGAINLNNMIPVIDEALLTLELDREDENYKMLLRHQIEYINDNAEKICEKAKKLYISVTKYHSFFKSRCAKFKELEKICKEYKR